MTPLKLKIEDFCGYGTAEIDFNDFSSAVIIGNIKGNDKFSNGCGKSTIFNAIKYAIFNEISFSSLEKIIRHGIDVCKVSFEFQSDMDDNSVYKIIRSKSKKGGSDVRLFRRANNEWEDITQRRNTDTEKEINKIIKINYKTFCNSVLFAQKDKFNIAEFTPEKRKIVLKDVLQLSVYSKYEAFTKKKSNELVKEIEKYKTIISTLGDPEKDIKDLEIKVEEISTFIQEKEKILIDEKKYQSDETKLYSDKESKYSDLEKQLSNFISTKSKLEIEINKIQENIDEYNRKINSLSKEGKELILNKTSLLEDIENLHKFKVHNILEINKNLEKTLKEISLNQTEYKITENRLIELKIPVPKNSTCGHCRQNITDESRDNCISKINKEIEEKELFLLNLKSYITKIKTEENDERKLVLQQEKYEKEILNKQNSLDLKLKEIENKRHIYSEYKSLLDNSNSSFLNKKEELSNLIKENLNSNLDELAKIKLDIKESKLKLDTLNTNVNKSIFENNQLSNNKAVLINKIDEKNKDIEKLLDLNKNLYLLENNFILHQKVIQAFSSGGIPALITHNILDDYQYESNVILTKLRPGLQSRFFVIKDRADGDQEDTLEIAYTLNGHELEYAQLSGAQQVIASFALKLGLLAIIKKRLGVDIKMILIDEVDQAIDEGSLEIFEEVVRKLQEDYKILLITHNNNLKAQFNTAILVEQDENFISTAKVVNAW
jgi:DNA repair exonuclease SbcCD ATPase subunit